MGMIFQGENESLVTHWKMENNHNYYPCFIELACQSSVFLSILEGVDREERLLQLMKGLERQTPASASPRPCIYAHRSFS